MGKFCHIATKENIKKYRITSFMILELSVLDIGGKLSLRGVTIR